MKSVNHGLRQDKDLNLSKSTSSPDSNLSELITKVKYNTSQDQRLPMKNQNTNSTTTDM